MKCPTCQAKLLPVAGEQFCLQCGMTVHEAAKVGDNEMLRVEDTVDPILQRAIRDAGDRKTKFVQPAETKPEPEKPAGPNIKAEQPIADPSKASAAEVPHRRKSFVSLHSIVMPVRALTPSGSYIVAPLEPRGPAAQADNIEQKVKPSGAAVRAWSWAFVSLSLVLGVNLAATEYYANRVYPGVRVAGVAVGGWTFDEVQAKLAGALTTPSLKAQAGGQVFTLDLGTGAGLQQAKLVEEAQQAGRQAPLSLIGIAQTWLAAPIMPSYSIADSQLDDEVEALAARLERQPSDAVVVMNGTSPLVLAEKPGLALDREAAKAAIRQAYGRTASVNLSLTKIQPHVITGELQRDVAAAQSIIGQTVHLKVGKADYVPTDVQIATWTRVSGPGQGAAVDVPGVQNYVAGLPGKFDRVKAAAGLIALLNAHQGGVVTADVNHLTNLAAGAAVSKSVATFGYCTEVDGEPSPPTQNFVEDTLNASWSFGGQIKFAAATSNCNFFIHIASGTNLGLLDPACAKQTTCRIHNDLGINKSVWSAAPATWKGNVNSYRRELVNQVAGQWLGFDHPSCQAGAPSVVMYAASVTVPGCSPKWYPVPAELQDTKVLGGFQ